MEKIGRKTRHLLNKLSRAFAVYNMVDEGDRIAVAISGGHDSMSLLHLLQLRQAIVPQKYDLVAVHILGESAGPDAYIQHQPLIDWIKSRGVEYVIEPMKMAEGEKLPMDCYRCSWNRRSTIFQVANRLGCSKIAFGHHLDDMVETALMNLLYQGRVASMYPCASYFKGAFHLIRPLVYISKKELNNFAIRSNLPDPPPQCPRADISKRKAISDILTLDDQSYQNMRMNIFRATMNHMEMEDRMKGESEEQDLEWLEEMKDQED